MTILVLRSDATPDCKYVSFPDGHRSSRTRVDQGKGHLGSDLTASQEGGIDRGRYVNRGGVG